MPTKFCPNSDCPNNHVVPRRELPLPSLFCVACGMPLATVRADRGQLVIRGNGIELAFALIENGKQLVVADTNELRPTEEELPLAGKGTVRFALGDLLLAFQEGKEWVEPRAGAKDG